MVACQALATHLLTAAEQLGTPRALRAAAWNGATVAALAGDGRQAAALAERALAAHALLDAPRSTGRLRARLAANLQRASPAAHGQARTMLLQAHAELGATAASAVDLAYCQLELARSDLLARHAGSAAHRAQELAARHPDAGNLVADAELLHAEALCALGEPQRARPRWRGWASNSAGWKRQLELRRHSRTAVGCWSNWVI
ncbi:hypothetical protein [Nonomuraea jabiensis]|uniref:hypothetical protein n=1 Tax=Nonomuraea jabiensis TaxID=882448 RepID=UPI003D76141B